MDKILELFYGDNLEILPHVPDNSIDSIVTDGHYGLKFMGKKWDYEVPSVELWKECLRVLKPGGCLLAFAGTRTQHRMACNIEDAGFEIRDMIAWVYGSGFPKSMNIGKAVDKLQGNEREVIDTRDVGHDITGGAYKDGKVERKVMDITVGDSEWEGWGTALKPAFEPITVARKPLSEKTVAANILKWGTGGINIDESRVGTEKRTNAQKGGENLNKLSRPDGNDLDDSIGMGAYGVGAKQLTIGYKEVQGRFPANFIFDGSDEVKDLFPNTKSGATKRHIEAYQGESNTGFLRGVSNPINQHGDEGSASRFFYCAKTNKKDRNKGCENLFFKRVKTDEEYIKITKEEYDLLPKEEKATGNIHPTVKPTDLMRYLVRLVTPKGGVVLDPFAGSGSTGKACIIEGFSYVLIEKVKYSYQIAKERLRI